MYLSILLSKCKLNLLRVDRLVNGLKKSVFHLLVLFNIYYMNILYLITRGDDAILIILGTL